MKACVFEITGIDTQGLLLLVAENSISKLLGAAAAVVS
jgi:hypothetical protein